MLEPSDRNKNTNHDNRHKNKEPACQTYPPLTVETLVNMRAQPGFSVFIPLHTLLLIPFHMDRNNKTLAPLPSADVHFTGEEGARAFVVLPECVLTDLRIGLRLGIFQNGFHIFTAEIRLHGNDHNVLDGVSVHAIVHVRNLFGPSGKVRYDFGPGNTRPLRRKLPRLPRLSGCR